MINNIFLKQIINIFENTEDVRFAHKRAEEIMKKIAEDKSSINEIIEYNLSKPNFWLKKRHYPTLSLDVFKNDFLEIVINIYPNLPNEDVNTSFQSIHHHGNLMLSTIGISGPGYSSISFKKNFSINKDNNSCFMEIESNYQNELKKYSFCDAYQPHIVFYPKEVSATFAIWSKVKRNKTDKIKKIFSKKLKKKLSFLVQLFGLSKLANMNTPNNYDFYIESNSIFAMKDRIHYPIGSNDNFLQNIFYYFQSVNYENYQFLEILKNKEFVNELGKKWIAKYLNKETIKSKFEDIHLNIDRRVNIKRYDIEKVFKN